MSRWSARSGRYSSPARGHGDESPVRRGQVEPLAALVAVLAVGFALALYVDALAAARPPPTESGVADATLPRVRAAVTDGSVARPELLADAVERGPEGHDVNVTLSTDERTWTAGPVAPAEAPNASRPVGVRRAPGRIEPGLLRVVVWT